MFEPSSVRFAIGDQLIVVDADETEGSRSLCSAGFSRRIWFTRAISPRKL